MQYIAGAMNRNMRIRISVVLAFSLVLAGLPSYVSAQTGNAIQNLRLISIDTMANKAAIANASQQSQIVAGQTIANWTLMAVLQEPSGPLAVLEDLTADTGDIVYLGRNGSVVTLPKTAEPTSALDDTLYAGHTLMEVADSKVDILAPSLLEGGNDPDYDKVAAILPPLRVPSFVGTPYGDDKPTYDYGAFSDEIYVDLGKLFPEMQQSRQRHDVREGLIGGWLPVNRFVFPAGDQRYWEESMFADVEQGHFWTQPVWYRALLIDHGQVKEAHYFYHHLPFPPRKEPAAAEFYRALLHVHTQWQTDLHTSMQIDVPDKHLADFNRRALSLTSITRVNNHPKYGYPPLGGINVFGGYGYNNVDTFQDTFNSDVTAFVEWGSFDVARAYIDDYFTEAVRDDGSIDTRGPEIGQYGKMLTTVAKYYAYSGDGATLRKYQKKLFAITGLLESLHDDSRKLPVADVSYGIIRGWSEHDSSLKVDPYRFMLPHLANNAEAARGFHDLGQAWLSIAQKSHDHSLEAQARHLLEQSNVLRTDLEAAFEHSVDRTQSPPYVPAVAGDTPTYGKQRAYMEMLESGELTQKEESMLWESLAARGSLLLGLPRGGSHLTGFLAFGPPYASLQFDHPQEFLLGFYAQMTHIYSPGTWTSTESAKLDGTLGGPYATPSQDSVPIFTKWMLVFEQPDEPILWLGRAAPRVWMESGKHFGVSGAPTSFGIVGYQVTSDLAHDKVAATVEMPADKAVIVKLRLRTPGRRTIHSVTVNGSNWSSFSQSDEAIDLPASSLHGTVQVTVVYE
jgi:hypothetical protein